MIVAKNKNSALELIRMAIDCFRDIGLNININKSVAINIARGNLYPHPLKISDSTTIACLSPTST